MNDPVRFSTLPDVTIAMRKTAVLAVGDIMLDRFVYGEVHRMSPEAPVPVLSVSEEKLMLGGAGNVLSNLHGLGVKAHVVSIVGADSAAESIRKLVLECGADPGGLLETDDRPTILKTRFLSGHQHLLRTDYERAAPVSAALEAQILERVDIVLPQVQAVIFSDYGKGVLTPFVIASVIDKAAKLYLPILVDPKGSNYTIYKGAGVVTPNRKELAEATGGMRVQNDEEIVKAAGVVINAGIKAVVATRSQDGMSIVQKDHDPVHLRTEAIKVFDVSGAGDTVIATIAAALAAGANLVTAGIIANVAAGQVVAKIGTAPVEYDELLAALVEREARSLAASA